MRKCPFCKKEALYHGLGFIQLEDGRWNFMHHCDLSSNVMITADTKEEIIKIWDGEYDEEHFTDL